MTRVMQAKIIPLQRARAREHEAIPTERLVLRARGGDLDAQAPPGAGGACGKVVVRLPGIGLDEAVGVGERVGNTEMDLLLVNLKLLGLHDYDLSRLAEYCEAVAEATGTSIPYNYPVIGEDAFRTGTGVHAAAIIKAREKGDEWLADLVYSGVPAAEFGRRQRIEISHMSGMSNVRYWLAEHGYDATNEALARRVFELAKSVGHTLSEEEVHECCARFAAESEGSRSPGGAPVDDRGAARVE